MAESKRRAIVKKSYLVPDGDPVKSARPDATGLVFESLETGETFTVNINDLPVDTTAICAMWHGASQKLGDVYADARKKGLDPIQEVKDLWERLCGGEWVTVAKAGGGSPSMLVDAILRVLASKGREETDELRDSVREKCKDADNRKRYHDDPEIEAAYTEIQLEKAKERAAAAKKAAKGAESGDALSEF